MKKLITIFLVSLAITLAGASVANASFSKVFTDGSLNVPAGVTLEPLAHPFLYSESDARVVDLIGGWEVLDGDSGNVTDTDALANIGSTKAEARTRNLYVASQAVAAPPQFGATWAIGYAIQQWPFIATAGDHEFTLNYTISQDMDTDVPGEWASAMNRFGVYVYNENLGGGWYNSTELFKEIYDGDSYSCQDNGSLYVTGNFADGDTGYLTFYALSDAAAYTLIPAPGAVVLGTIGVGLIGWLRRRRTI